LWLAYNPPNPGAIFAQGLLELSAGNPEETTRKFHWFKDTSSGNPHQDVKN
jgi:hypothetical protein